MHVSAVFHLRLLPFQDKALAGSSPFGTLPPKPPGHDASADDNPFGTRKARSSFGRGFFKIKGSKRTASAPNLGTYGQNAFALLLSEQGREWSPSFLCLSTYTFFFLRNEGAWHREKISKKMLPWIWFSGTKVALCSLSPCTRFWGVNRRPTPSDSIINSFPPVDPLTPCWHCQWILCGSPEAFPPTVCISGVGVWPVFHFVIPLCSLHGAACDCVRCWDPRRSCTKCQCTCLRYRTPACQPWPALLSPPSSSLLLASAILESELVAVKKCSSLLRSVLSTSCWKGLSVEPLLPSRNAVLSNANATLRAALGDPEAPGVPRRAGRACPASRSPAFTPEAQFFSR